MRRMIAKAVLTVLVAMASGAIGAAAQGVPPAPAELERLDWLVGEWEGEGWIEAAPGQRARFRGTEVVERRMGGRLVVVEGSFVAWMGPERGDVPVHQALGIFSYDAAAGGFRFRTYTARGAGSGGVQDAEVEAGRIVWGYDDPRQGLVRYTIERTEAGAWREQGHASGDGGATWTQFFEMELTRR